ncbi:MAG: 6-bladed beta-propeller [Gemmatimonadales bacterium]|nr:6-bladed beta-propeller [Candidatus Palauibacter irciniicola]MYC19768.1 6-bladed beta-propeller [Gemmatimonadales bacterium]
MIKAVLAVGAAFALAAGLPAQERRDTLVAVSRLAVPDSVPLTYIEQLVHAADGSMFMLDARTEGVLAFGPNGAFRQRIGRRGEGPGELLSPWRLGMLGRDTLWVADARRRVNLYDASTGESLEDFGPATWDAATAGGEIVRPFAALADHSIMAFRWAERDVLAEVLAFRVGRGAVPEGAPLALLDLRDRSVAARIPTGDGSLRLRNPFSHSDMIAVGPGGRRITVIRRPRPEGSPAFFVAERHDVLRGIVEHRPSVV